jgi:hypothetical protein
MQLILGEIIISESDPLYDIPSAGIGLLYILKRRKSRVSTLL